MSQSEGTGSFEIGTTIALRQVQVAIGAVMGQIFRYIWRQEVLEEGDVDADLSSSLFLPTGLFAASLVTYSFSRRKRSAYFSY